MDHKMTARQRYSFVLGSMLMGFGFASVAGRPTDFDEASTSYMHRFVTGMSVGLGDIITFTGVFAKEEVY